MENDDGHDFIIVQPVWLAGFKTRPENLRDLSRSLIRIDVQTSNGALQSHIAVLTDEDQAQRLIDELSKNDLERQKQLEAFEIATPAKLSEILRGFQDAGETHIALDPGAKHGPVIAIERFHAEWIEKKR